MTDTTTPLTPEDYTAQLEAASDKGPRVWAKESERQEALARAGDKAALTALERWFNQGPEYRGRR